MNRLKRPVVSLAFSLGLLLLSSANAAQPWQVAKYLQVEPPESVDVTFQILEGLDPDNEAIVGWKGEDLDYFLLVEKLSRFVNPEKYLNNIAKSSARGDNSFKVDKRASFKDQNGIEIPYQIHSGANDNERVPRIYQLNCVLKGEKLSYFISASSVTGDIDSLEAGLVAILAASKVTR